MKIRPGGDTMFDADRQTDMTKLTDAFCKFANAPKIWKEILNQEYTAVQKY